MQHQAFAARADDFVELAAQRGVVRQTELFNRDKLREAGPGDDLFDLFVALGKRARRVGQFKDHVFDLPPFVILRRRFADGARQLFELPTRHPQLSVERARRQFGNEPRRRGDHVARARTQRLAIPQRAHAVIFFADEIRRRVNVDVGNASEQGARRSVGRLSLRQRRKPQTKRAKRSAKDWLHWLTPLMVN